MMLCRTGIVQESGLSCSAAPESYRNRGAAPESHRNRTGIGLCCPAAGEDMHDIRLGQPGRYMTHDAIGHVLLAGGCIVASLPSPLLSFAVAFMF